ncbi:pyridine nucleotide-disulfide oxidoreductase [Chryseobacterium sp. T16E-39]|uniref:NAD(P)/FAD-dependent oxidoreductase n=1 Tax=Chryseobacterium sp. T16E-39 TaxID=2015076 RepID=UPI000B5B2705|nr:NAD(P)/FAD-dependent oxidoreductase [Chryseobacterium sp. T16E-39]ASK30389.1 pyridine nucleotide-disulfide oxidoreductase [Chryseobacterium sp. T16E-39]
MEGNHFDIIIIGGSYAGLSAAMALGRSLRNVLIIDNGKPCNEQTPHSHNFLTQDGKTPKEISEIAKAQVRNYHSVEFYDDTAVKVMNIQDSFEVTTKSGQAFRGKKLIVAAGIFDMKPGIPGFSECWGISVLHCPYCHGYEVKYEKTGIIGNGDFAFEFSKMISHWTKDLTLFTNGKSDLDEGQRRKLQENNIQVNENEIESLEHINGKVEAIVFKNGSRSQVKAIYSKVPFVQNLNILEDLGIELAESGHIKTDAFYKTNIYGVYACGDSSSMMRSVANAVGSGNTAGAMVNKELIEEEF